MHENSSLRMFKSDASALAAIDLEMEIEKAVRLGIRIARRKFTGIKMDPRACERRAIPVIHKMLADINPEMLGNIRKIDERVIWAVYWHLQEKSLNMKISFFKLLIDLDKSQSFVARFA